jgi:hypothetical protein
MKDAGRYAYGAGRFAAPPLSGGESNNDAEKSGQRLRAKSRKSCLIVSYRPVYKFEAGCVKADFYTDRYFLQRNNSFSGFNCRAT